MHLYTLLCAACFLCASATQSSITPTISNNQTVSIPEEAAYMLPLTFQGNISRNFIDTDASNITLDILFSRARSSPFISYSAEFTTLLGPNPQLSLVAQRPDAPFAFEAGVWVPSKNEVWFVSAIHVGNATFYILNLNTSQIYQLNLSQPIVNPNGGYYFNGKVYLTALRNETYAGGIYSIDPYTFQTEIVVNSYFGVRFNSPDDVT